MNTRSTLDLTDTSIRELQLNSNPRKRISSAETIDTNSNPIKEETSLSPTPFSNLFNNFWSISQPPLVTMDNDDLIELEEIQRKHSNLEKRFLHKIPMFNNSKEIDIEEFLSKFW